VAPAKVESDGRLEEAMTTLLQNQAILVQIQASFLARMSDVEQRLARIESILREHSRMFREILDTLNDRIAEIVDALPDRIGRKFGIKRWQLEPPAE
jgi:hypothetical protein